MHDALQYIFIDGVVSESAKKMYNQWDNLSYKGTYHYCYSTVALFY